MKPTCKSIVVLNDKNVVTEYLSILQCRLLLDHITTVIHNGLSNHYKVSKVDVIPSSLSVIFKFEDGFIVVSYNNTYSDQSTSFTIHKYSKIRLILKFVMTLI